VAVLVIVLTPVSVGVGVHARMPTGGMPTSENCLVRAECQPWLGRMPTGRNAEYSHYERETIAISILYWWTKIIISYWV